MLTISGVIQIGAILKEETTREGLFTVLFTGYAKRGQVSDKVLLKAIGNDARYLMNNLSKRDDGSYISRKITISGFYQTYKKTKRETSDPQTLSPDTLDARFGFLKQPIQIQFSKEVVEDRSIILINYLEFVDKRRESEFVEVFATSQA